MRTVDDIMERVRRLPPGQRRELIERMVDLEGQAATQLKKPARRSLAYACTLKLAGKGHSTFTDVADDKYKHLAEVYADKHQ